MRNLGEILGTFVVVSWLIAWIVLSMAATYRMALWAFGGG